MIALLVILLSGVNPAELESAGLLAEAGAAWQEKGSIPGQARVMCRMLEEALYAGCGERALLLVMELEPVCGDTALAGYWTARAAWSAGLPEVAAAELDLIVSQDPWLYHRSRGTAALYREQAGVAVNEFLLSIALADTGRKKFWSGIDLCLAYLSDGRIHEALALSELLLYNYTGDDFARVMYGLCLHASGDFSTSAGVLAGTGSSNPSAERLADLLMEGFEQ